MKDEYCLEIHNNVVLRGNKWRGFNLYGVKYSIIIHFHQSLKNTYDTKFPLEISHKTQQKMSLPSRKLDFSGDIKESNANADSFCVSPIEFQSVD